MLAQRYGEAWNRQDLDAIMDLHAEDSVFVAHAAGSPPADGKEAVRDAFAGYLAILPDINFAERSLHVGEDHWVSGVHDDRHRRAGDRGRGRVLRHARRPRRGATCVDVIEVRDGLVASKHTYLDTLEMQRQLGGDHDHGNRKRNRHQRRGTGLGRDVRRGLGQPG